METTEALVTGYTFSNLFNEMRKAAFDGDTETMEQVSDEARQKFLLAHAQKVDRAIVDGLASIPRLVAMYSVDRKVFWSMADLIKSSIV